MTTTRLLTLAALLATASALQGCDFGPHSGTQALFDALGADPLPGAAAEPVIEMPEIEQVVPDTSTPEPIVEQVVTPPVPVLNEYQIWQTDPTYVCVPQFRIKSCTDWGEPVWLDNQMAWLPFGVVP